MESAEFDWVDAPRRGPAPWDLFSASPALEAFAERGGLAELGLPPGARVAVPGCGRGHDLRLLAKQGLRATGFDLVPEVVAEARQLAALNRVDARVLCRDVLGLCPEFAGAFDLVYDCACLCALPPHLRAAYAKAVAGILTPGGVLLALVFPLRAEHAGRGGPPYLVRPAEAEAVFAPLVLERSFATGVEHHRRAGAERWYVWRKQAPQS